MSDTQNRIIKLVAEHLDLDVEKVKPESRFQEDLGADSLDQVEMVMAFEEEFGIEIPDSAAEKIVKISDAVKYVEEQKKAA